MLDLVSIVAIIFAFGASIAFGYGAWKLMVPAQTKNQRKESPISVLKARISPTIHKGADALRASLAAVMRGDVSDSSEDRAKYSRDTSIFERTPEMVVFPKDADDVAALVKEIAKLKQNGKDVSVTARSAGTDMSGGPLTNSIVAVFTKYMNKMGEVKQTAGGGYAVTQPGVYYRDFEKETLAHGGLMLESYPASRELAAMGGILNNNSGGERTLEFGKTEKYVESVDVVLSDGTQTTFSALTNDELEAKKNLTTLEGDIYKKIDALLIDNAAVIEKAKPKVSKNSAGYALWSIKNKQTGTFNLAKLICGAQGTLALTTSMKFSLVKDQGSRSMLVAFLSKRDVPHLPGIVKAVLPHNPESFESFDEHTLTLAIKFLPGLLSQMGIMRAIRLGLSFLPEAWMSLTGGLPNLILMAEFSEDTHEAALAAANAAQKALIPFSLQTSVLKDEKAAEKYWIVRRESFALLRKHSKGLYAAPFIDDLIVPPDSYPKFLPALNALLDEYKEYFIYTVAGHIGNGNFHIIPLMDLSKPDVRNVITELAPKVYDLVMQFGGSTTGEHNDGIIRTPYLPKLFGPEMYKLFEDTKRIFDPQNIFNPGKKVGGTFADIKKDMLTHTS
ncbi:MAG: putative oxidoreductase [Parcubacteria group bacterium]|nr:putative oxidoreductase [Parcubacteria group bacterium]